MSDITEASEEEVETNIQEEIFDYWKRDWRKHKKMVTKVHLDEMTGAIYVPSIVHTGEIIC
jgi:hypothetical protein